MGYSHVLKGIKGCATEMGYFFHKKSLDVGPILATKFFRILMNIAKKKKKTSKQTKKQ